MHSVRNETSMVKNIKDGINKELRNIFENDKWTGCTVTIG